MRERRCVESLKGKFGTQESECMIIEETHRVPVSVVCLSIAEYLIVDRIIGGGAFGLVVAMIGLILFARSALSFFSACLFFRTPFHVRLVPKRVERRLKSHNTQTSAFAIIHPPFLVLVGMCVAANRNYNGWGSTCRRTRLLALLALAFRSHQLYFSHAHDVTQTLQTLRVSTSPNQSSAAAVAASATATKTRSKRHPSSSGAFSNGGALHQKVKRPPSRKGKSSTSTTTSRRRRHRPTTGVAAAAAAAAPKPPPPDARFFWNLGVLGPLLDLREGLEMARVDASGDTKNGGGSDNEVAAAAVGIESATAAVDRWLTPVMSGFLQVERGCRAGGRSFDVMFVSRRSRLRQGTRYTRRGIDDGGNVANFVETEQVREGGLD